uniref:Polo kinase n=1 Tax=Strongyloides papillosus TaxID=174720 RepID=A0A0N5BIZ1_STREA
MKVCEENSEEVPEIILDRRTRTQYHRGELLRIGSFGRYYLFTNLKTREKCVGKIIVKSGLNGMLNKVHQERNIHMSLEHPNILSMFCYIRCSTYICMTLELWDNTLGCVLERLKVLDEPSCRFVVREVACGISYLHENRIIHRDIKPANIFLTKDMDVKIGGFGVSTYHRDPTERMMERSGTCTYFAPESIDNSGYSFGVDVWALGVTLYKLSAGCYPFDDKDMFGLYEKIKSCDYDISSKVSVHTRDMIRILLDRDPDSRPAIDDVLKHDYLNPQSISKAHLIRYIYTAPFTKITNQKDLHRYNSMPHTRNKNIPKKDCKLDPSYRIEEIFQKGFNIDSSSGNKNILPRKDELNVEEQSNYLLKDLHTKISTLVGSSTPKEVSAPFRIADALSSCNRPKYFVSRWINLSEMYGFAYQLTDSSVGVLYRDNTRLTVDCPMENFQYIDESSVREYFEYDSCPRKLDKKLKLLRYFVNFMEMDSLANPPVEERKIGIVDGGIPILLKWKKHDGFICFLLSNGILQVTFFDVSHA